MHGCANELKELLNLLPLTKESTVVFLGDYIDRGGQSKQVIDTVLELKNQCNVVTLMGNHEAMFVDFLENPGSQKGGLFICNGGSATLASYADEAGNYEFPKEHLDFIRDLKVSYEDDHHYFVHAGVPNIPLDKIDLAKHKKKMLWIRAPFLNSTYKWKKVVVHGHTPVTRVDIRNNRINLDTGCVFRRSLSAVALPGQKIYSVPRQTVERPVYLRDMRSRRVALRFEGILPVEIRIEDDVYSFETIDYSEAGLFIKPVKGNPNLPEGTELTGQIGQQDGSTVFDGKIVRNLLIDGLHHYAVQVDNMIPVDDLPLPDSFPEK